MAKDVPAATERRSGKARKRPGVDPTTCERRYTQADLEFMQAVEAYKHEARRPFPTSSEILEILLALGYRKVAQRRPLALGPRKS